MTADASINLPSGLVTFVFTDIEASTRLLKVLSHDDAVAAFERHDELVREAWTAHRGVEVNTEGDSFFVAFTDVSDAIAACVDAQRKLAAEPWPGGESVRVRMGIHSGIATPRRDNYVSLAVHQATRVMAAGHGGQVLITKQAAGPARLGPEVRLTDIGDYRLRDFDDDAQLMRIDITDIGVNDLPVRATPANRHNLVAAMTSFIGRDADIVAVNGLLDAGHIVTIVGPGGVGKTRLATEVGMQMTEVWPDGVWMVELADVNDEELIAGAIADSLGAGAGPGGDRLYDTIEHLRDRHSLIILDNAEHVIDRTAAVAAELLRSCAGAAFLVTSREPLNLAGESVYRLPPLASNGRTPAADSAAVQLFIERASDTDSSFDATNHEETIASICRQLDGLPLAIEIAAARVGVMSIGEIEAGLGDRLRLLQSRDRSLPARQRTMEALLGWSYRLLDDGEQRAFRRLSVFGGDFGIEDSATAIAGDGLDEAAVPELVWSLVEKSLLSTDLSASSTRYRLAETVQHYALGLLIDLDDPMRISRQLADRYLQRLGPWVTNDRHWLGDMALEITNVRRVVELLGDVEVERAQQLMCSIGRYHDSVQSYGAGIEELTKASASLGTSSPALVSLYARLADLHLRQGATEPASTALEHAAAVQATEGAPSWDDVAVERTRGELFVRLGQLDEAIRLGRDTLERSITPHGQARMWNLVGIANYNAGDHHAARLAFEEELGTYQRLGDETRACSAHGNVAELAMRLDDNRAAAEHQKQCLLGAMSLGQPVLIGYSLLMAARLAARQVQWPLAIELQTIALQVLASAGHTNYPEDQRAIDRLVAEATGVLGTTGVRTAAERGAGLSIEQAAESARQTFDRVAQPTPLS